MKKIILPFIVLLLYGCAPHKHFYRSLNSLNKDELEIFCSLHDKIWLFNTDRKSAEIFIQSNHFPPLKLPKIMDTLSHHRITTQKTFRIRMKDNQFHKFLKGDTITITSKKNGIWNAEKFVIISDGRIR